MKSPFRLSARRDQEEAFVKGAEAPKAQDVSKAELPWDAPSVRNDVTKMFNLRLPESYKLKLDYISRHHRSAHQFCLDVVLPAIDEEIGRLTREKKK